MDPQEKILLSSELQAEQSAGDKTLEKMRERPFILIGVLGAIGMTVYGVRARNKRPKAMSMSLYFMRLRVLAQGIVVSALVLGASYEYYRGTQRRLEQINKTDSTSVEK